jgi:hypothetical protein
MPKRAPRSAVAGSVPAGELASLRRRATGSADADKPARAFGGGESDRQPSARARRGASYSDDTGGAARAPSVSAEASDRSECSQRGSVPWARGGAPEHRPTSVTPGGEHLCRTALITLGAFRAKSPMFSEAAQKCPSVVLRGVFMHRWTRSEPIDSTGQGENRSIRSHANGNPNNL